MANKVYICLGSNMGNRKLNLQQALLEIEQVSQIEDYSSIYVTEPIGYSEQRFFLNIVVQLRTNKNPRELLDFLKGIEKDMGRKPGVRYGPRIIDIDILLYNDEIIDQDGLKIPHARMHKRAFVLRPLVEISPDVMHPVLKKTAAELLEELKDNKHVKIYAQIKD